MEWMRDHVSPYQRPIDRLMEITKSSWEFTSDDLIAVMSRGWSDIGPTPTESRTSITFGALASRRAPPSPPRGMAGLHVPPS